MIGGRGRRVCPKNLLNRLVNAPGRLVSSPEPLPFCGVGIVDAVLPLPDERHFQKVRGQDGRVIDRIRANDFQRRQIADPGIIGRRDGQIQKQ